MSSTIYTPALPVLPILPQSMHLCERSSHQLRMPCVGHANRPRYYHDGTITPPTFDLVVGLIQREYFVRDAILQVMRTDSTFQAVEGKSFRKQFRSNMQPQ